MDTKPHIKAGLTDEQVERIRDARASGWKARPEFEDEWKLRPGRVADT